MGYSTPTDTQIHRCPAPYVTWRRGFTYSCVDIVILHSLGINNRKDNACTFSGQAWFISQECLSRICRYGSNTYRISRTLVSLPFTRAMWAAFHCLQWKKPWGIQYIKVWFFKTWRWRKVLRCLCLGRKKNRKMFRDLYVSGTTGKNKLGSGQHTRKQSGKCWDWG